MPDVRELLASKVMPKVFGALGDAGLFDLVNIVYLKWSDDGKGGRTQQERVRNAQPVRCKFTAKNSSRKDEGGNWESYVKHGAKLLFFSEDERVVVEQTDKIKRLATSVRDEAIFEIKTVTAGDLFYELVVEEDTRSGKRVQGA